VSAGTAKHGKNMGDLPQWVCWRAELREGKATKVPYSPESGSRARSDDPATWGTLSEAKKAAREKDLDGIGFVFTESDPFCGVDLDACVDPKTGENASWASEIVGELDSYTEFSPSGTGLQVLLRAELPSGGNRRARIEMYDRGRFFTVSGRRMRGTSHVLEERQEQAVSYREMSRGYRCASGTRGFTWLTHAAQDARAARREPIDGKTEPATIHGPPLPYIGFLLSREWTYGRAAACPQPKNAVPFKRNGNKSAARSLESLEGLLEVQDHIPSVLDANREAHQVLPDPQPLPPRRRELAVRGGGRMDGEGVDVS
jgi:hypothetical protein